MSHSHLVPTQPEISGTTDAATHGRRVARAVAMVTLVLIRRPKMVETKLTPTQIVIKSLGVLESKLPR
jgi:hypothetical protein